MEPHPKRPVGIECLDWSPHPMAKPGGKRCASYVEGGACARQDRLMCEEWLRANPHMQRIDAFEAHAALNGLPTEKRNGLLCPECRAPQVITPQGTSCPNGHGGLAGILPVVGDALAPPIVARPEERARQASHVGRVNADGSFALAPPLPSPKGESAKEKARRAYAIQAAGAPTPSHEVDLVYAPAREIAPERIDALVAVADSIELSTPDLGVVTLCARRTGEEKGIALTYEEAATVRLLVDAFPGARVVGIRLHAKEKR